MNPPLCLIHYTEKTQKWKAWYNRMVRVVFELSFEFTGSFRNNCKR